MSVVKYFGTPPGLFFLKEEKNRPSFGFFALGEFVVRDLPFNMSRVTYLSLGLFEYP